jgi:hypothetical protein
LQRQLSCPGKLSVEAGKDRQGRHGGGVAGAEKPASAEMVGVHSLHLPFWLVLVFFLGLNNWNGEVEVRMKIIHKGESVVAVHGDASIAIARVARNDPTRHNSAKARNRRSVQAVERCSIVSKDNVGVSGAV